MAKNEERSGYVEIFIPESPENSVLHNKNFSVNGKFYSVPVGIPVMVPEELAAVWEEAKFQQKATRAAVVAAQDNVAARDKAFMG